MGLLSRFESALAEPGLGEVTQEACPNTPAVAQATPRRRPALRQRLRARRLG